MPRRQRGAEPARRYICGNAPAKEFLGERPYNRQHVRQQVIRGLPARHLDHAFPQTCSATGDP
jgi:hypothetical protein